MEGWKLLGNHFGNCMLESNMQLTAGVAQIQHVLALALKFVKDFFHTGKEGLVKELFVYI